MTYVEYGSYLDKNTFYYEEMFKNIVKMKPKAAKEAAEVLSRSF